MRMQVMRRALAVLPLLLLTACGGYSPAEQAYLTEIKDRGIVRVIPDPDAEVEFANATCHTITAEPGHNRRRVIEQLTSIPTDGPKAESAIRQLCPEVLSS